VNRDLDDLAAALDGALLRPGDPDYDAERLLFNSRFDDVTPAAVAKVAGPADVQQVMAFAHAVDVPLLPHRMAICGGTCPTVGIAGLTLGGGLGVLSRRCGATSDNLVEAEVVTPDGQVRRASAQEEPDLFWALRGAGADGLGIVTERRRRQPRVARGHRRRNKALPLQRLLQNYADPALDDPTRAYYGANAERLLEVRRLYTRAT
jgi:FAD binding domain